jgi:hypothetical protein
VAESPMSYYLVKELEEGKNYVLKAKNIYGGIREAKRNGNRSVFYDQKK